MQPQGTGWAYSLIEDVSPCVSALIRMSITDKSIVIPLIGLKLYNSVHYTTFPKFRQGYLKSPGDFIHMAEIMDRFALKDS